MNNDLSFLRNFSGQLFPSPKEFQKKDSNFRLQSFIQTKSHSKNIFKFQTSGRINSLRQSTPSIKRRSRVIHGFDQYIEEINLREIYKIDYNSMDMPKLVQKFNQIKDCSILKYGLKPSNEDIDFSFCRTCDPNSINPICSACIKICHKGHKIKKKFMKGEIKCNCGERLHCISKRTDINNNSISCQLGEWFTVSKLNFYYKTKDSKCLCMLCYNFCNNDKSKENIQKINLENNGQVHIPHCCCNNDEIHQGKKALFERLQEITDSVDYFDYFNLLHPSQIINMIFLSKNQFNINYDDLNYLNEILTTNNFLDTTEFNFFKKADFSATNFYLIFTNLIGFIKGNKHSDITYFCKEVEDYFSFKKTKLVLSLINSMKFNEKSFWILSSKFLLLFHKINIGNKTQSFSKFKLNDLENFSFNLRWICKNTNEKYFKEKQNIISYLISLLKNISILGFSCIETVDTIYIIVKILNKMSNYNLINNGDMIRIIQEIEKIFLGIENLKKLILTKNIPFLNFDKENEQRKSIVIQKNFEILSDKEIKLCYTILKLLRNFLICFNDRLIHNALFNSNKYPSIDSINKDSVIFSFEKTDLGRALIKLVIFVLDIIQNISSKYPKKEKLENILKHGIKILSGFIRPDDSYLLNIIQSIKNNEFYVKENELDESSDLEYKEILKEKNRLEKCYKNFFIFEISLENVIQEVNQSLDVILKGKMKESKKKSDKKFKGLVNKKILCILKSNYYFSLSKFFQILHFSECKNEKLPEYFKNLGLINNNEESISNLVDKIIDFYKNFIHNSSDNSFLLMSNYVFKDLCKAPVKYGLKIFELFSECIDNIINNSTIISNYNNYIKNLYQYLDHLSENNFSKINHCLLMYLNIVELLLLKTKCLNPEEIIVTLKDILIKINKEYKLAYAFLKNKSNGREDDEITEKSFLSYIKIVNDIFDFTIEKDKKNICYILKPEKFIFALKNYNMHLNLRTELLRYIRKIHIDLSYNESSNLIYANSIICKEDHLYLLKTNPLISNLRYPTKFLSFIKDFINLSVGIKMNEINDKKEETIKNFTFKQQNINKIDETETFLYQNKIRDKIAEVDEEKEEEDEMYENPGIDTSSLYSDIKSKISSKPIDSKKESQIFTLKKCFDDDIYDLLIYELKNVKEIISEINMYIDSEMEILRNYFENGLLIPIIFFLKKTFVFSHILTGSEMLKLYELVIECLNFRLYLAEFKYDFWKESLDTKSNSDNIEKKSNNINTLLDYLKKEEENFCRLYNKRTSIIDGSFCVNSGLNISTKNSLNLLKSKQFLGFDFTTLYLIFEQNIFSLLKDRNINTYSQLFSNERQEVSLKMLQNEENNLFNEYQFMNDIEKRILRLYLIYKHCKSSISNENNSSLINILTEINLENETNYRNLLVSFLINIGTKLDLKDSRVAVSFYLLYKLLSLQTTETQNYLISLIEGNGAENKELGFVSNFGNHLFKKIVFLFIEFFNPPDQLLDSNYALSLLLIKIFKYLCEEHNNYFQGLLIRKLNYEYSEIIPVFFREETKEEEEESKSDGQLENPKISKDSKNIKFFDFFLHVILKIILISSWDKLDYNNDNYNKKNEYLYDIFEAILEMLNEIIQGNKPEFLNIIGNSSNSFIENEIENNDKLIEEMEEKPILFSKFDTALMAAGKDKNEYGEEKIDNFQYFVKNVTEFIFDDKVTNELLLKIKNNLMEFFNTILEEKISNDDIPKFIIKYFSLNRVFNSIGSILKSYYLKEYSENDIEKILKTIKLDFSNLGKTLNMNRRKNIYKRRSISKRQSNPQFLRDYGTNDFSLITSSILEKNNMGVSLNFSSKFVPIIKKDIIRTKRKKEKHIIFNSTLFEFYKNLYFSSKEFNQTNEFKLSNTFYKYIKIIAVLNKSDEAKLLIEHADLISPERVERKFQSHIILMENNRNSAHLKDNKPVNKISSTNLNTNLLNIKKLNGKKSKFADTYKINDSAFIDLNINKNISETEKKMLFKENTEKILKKKIKFNSLINENSNGFDKDSIEHYFIIKFFECITTTVEVRKGLSQNQTVIFTLPPEIKYLSKGTKAEFEREVNRDSETSKKNDLIRNVIYFQKEIKYYQKKHSIISNWISKIDFLYVEIISYIYAIFFNLLILFTLDGDKIISNNNNIEENIIKERREDKKAIQLSIDSSIYNWGMTYNIICYIYVCFNGICTLLWIYFRMPLYYKIDRLKYMEENNVQNKKQLKLYQKIYIILVMTIYKRDYISTLVYEFIFSLIGSFMKRGEIVYAFLLLPIIDLNNILKNILVSMKLQYNEVCLTFFFSGIIMYAFSNFAYFFFNDDFIQSINYLEDNVCKTLIFCFLNTLDSGLRARGGIGDSAIRISYKLNKSHYIQRILMDDTFFLLIVITAIDLVFGIIIGAFSNLRNEEQKHMNDKKNHCFICHANRNEFEKNKQNFSEHRNKIHNFWNYVNYMITLKFSNLHDLNAINYYTIQKIEKKDISWLPTYKDLNNHGKNGKNTELDEELKIEDENSNKYFIKKF